MERKLREIERRLAAIRKDSAVKEVPISKLPKRELALLSANQENYLSTDRLLSRTHYNGANVGRSPGSGKIERRAMPERFATAFMAPGHEQLTTEKHVNVPMAKVGVGPRGIKWRIVGKADTVPSGGK